MKNIDFMELKDASAQANSLIGSLVTSFLDFAWGLDAYDEALEIVMELFDEHEILYNVEEVEDE